MKNINKFKNIKGNLDMFVAEYEDEFQGELLKWNEILIHGDVEGLRSLAKLLIELADVNQEDINNNLLPVGERIHIGLTPNQELSKSSDHVVIGRLDAKGTKEYYDSYSPKD